MNKDDCVITKKSNKGEMEVILCKMIDGCNCGSPNCCSKNEKVIR